MGWLWRAPSAPTEMERKSRNPLKEPGPRRFAIVSTLFTALAGLSHSLSIEEKWANSRLAPLASLVPWKHVLLGGTAILGVWFVILAARLLIPAIWFYARYGVRVIVRRVRDAVIHSIWIHPHQEDLARRFPYYQAAMLRESRLLNVTALDLAELLDVPYSVGQYLLDHPNEIPRRPLWEPIARALCIDVEYFTSGPSAPYSRKTAVARLHRYASQRLLEGFGRAPRETDKTGRLQSYLKRADRFRSMQLGLDAQEEVT